MHSPPGKLEWHGVILCNTAMEKLSQVGIFCSHRIRLYRAFIWIQAQADDSADSLGSHIM